MACIATNVRFCSTRVSRQYIVVPVDHFVFVSNTTFALLSAKFLRSGRSIGVGNSRCSIAMALDNRNGVTRRHVGFRKNNGIRAHIRRSITREGRGRIMF